MAIPEDTVAKRNAMQEEEIKDLRAKVADLTRDHKRLGEELESRTVTVGELRQRIESMRKTHDQDIERTLQRMERKVDARDHTIAALQGIITQALTGRPGPFTPYTQTMREVR